MASLSSVGLAFYVLVLIGAFAVRSAAGFGAGLIAVPMLAFILPVSTAVSVATALTTLTSVGQVGRDWRHIAWRQFAVLEFYTIIGIGMGFYFIRFLDERSLRRGLGVFLIVYSLHALWKANASPVLAARWHGLLAAVVGILGGLFSALFGGGVGPIYVVYFNILRLRRDAFRVTMSAVVLIGGAARIGGYASYGLYGGSAISLLALGLPLVIVGSWVGDRLARWFSVQAFSRFVGGLVLLSGIALLVK
ncbi:MAG TPA: sulfite exporter TauE/SafE family protein [Stellaceae bacterium]|nr:sulfite exporter TauE/SafE family protein [Stellaceae bacterium]